ncbi:hypothetical protein KAV67_04275, partial [Candidatus Bipolaricaulota bacterium]|nr:hypothetical protein [Candidatus Bipolaricaulota bacterium]
PAAGNFLLETAPDSGLFISNVAFKIGGRKETGSGSDFWTHTPGDLAGGAWLYELGIRNNLLTCSVLGRVENMNTLIVMYIDPDDPKDISTSLVKIEDTESIVEWSPENPANDTKTVTVRITDLDEDLNCDKREAVPVFFAINPGASVQTNTFCLFNRTKNLRWYNIYMAGGTDPAKTKLLSTSLKNLFELTGVTYGAVDTTLWAGLAMETGVGTGVFEFTIENLSEGFPTTSSSTYHSFSTNDVIVAYYLDPNDADDFQLASCYIGNLGIERVWFDDIHGSGDGYYNLGKDYLHIMVDDPGTCDGCKVDAVTVHICDPHGEDDSETLILAETGAATSRFDRSMKLLPVWDALGTSTSSGYQLTIQNGRFEAFNEDSVYVRYNGTSEHDVSFDLVKVYDTQVFNGTTLNLIFVDRDGNPVSFYQTDELAYIKVVDYDQNEDSTHKDIINSRWDGGLNKPFGPGLTNASNPYLAGGSAAFLATFAPTADKVFGSSGTPAKIYLWNPTNGRWSPVDLEETGVNTGVFMSKAGVPLYPTCTSCVAFAEDKNTVLAFYQDPSNHSDIAVAEIKVDNGASRTTFVDKDGNSVSEYKDTDSAYVLVRDREHGAVTTLKDAVTIDKISGQSYTLTSFEGELYTFITPAISLTALGGQTITATYVDPSDKTDTSKSSEISVVKTVYPAATATFVNSAGTAVTKYNEGASAYVKVVDQAHGTETTLTNALTIDHSVGTFTLTKPTGGDNYTFFSGAISLGDLAGVTIKATYTDPADSTRTATASIPVNATTFKLDFVTVLPNPFTTEVTFSIDGGTGFPDTFLVTVYDLARHEVWKSKESNVTEITWDGGDLANGPYIYVIVITSADLNAPYTKKGMVFINR